jgi:hypothetical protein
MKKEIQELFQHQITEWLTNEKLRPHLTRKTNKTLAETSFDLLIRWYPQVASNGRDSYGLDIIGRIENSMVSERARDLLVSICNDFQGTKSQLKVKLKRAVHFEHNSPVDVVKRKLIGLSNASIEDVKAILNEGYAIVLITKNEEESLRKKGLAKTGSFHERLGLIGAKVLNETSKEELISIIKNRLMISEKLFNK